MKFIEVEFYGYKGVWSSQVGKFRSIESLKKAWQQHLDHKSNSIRDDNGTLLIGICGPGYKILSQKR